MTFLTLKISFQSGFRGETNEMKMNQNMIYNHKKWQRLMTRYFTVANPKAIILKSSSDAFCSR